MTRTPNQPTYLPNFTAYVSATPRLGAYFVNWSGDGSGTTNPLPVVLTRNKVIFGNFQDIFFLLTTQGAGTIETYTVVHKREGPFMAIVVGRDENGRRFCANTPDDPQTLASLEASEQIGRTGQVTQAGELNLFTPD